MSVRSEKIKLTRLKIPILITQAVVKNAFARGFNLVSSQKALSARKIDIPVIK